MGIHKYFHCLPISCFPFLLIVLLGFSTFAFAGPNGFLSISCGGTASFTDSSNILWVPDDSYVSTGNATTVNFIEDGSSSQFTLRVFPHSHDRRTCYRLPVKNISSSLILIRPRFYYKNYDGLGKPPAFRVSLGTSTTNTVNLASSDPWVEEFIWPVTKDTLPFCLHAIPDGGFPVISSLEIRPIPPGAYESGVGQYTNKLLRKRYRVNCGYNGGSIRYPSDSFDRVWDVDQNFSPSHLSKGINVQREFNLSSLKETPPLSVLQSARVLARKNILAYNFPLDKLGDYYIVLYFAGILPISSSFDILINGGVVRSNFIVNSYEASTLFSTREDVSSLNITFRNISFYPQVNAIEVYEIIEIPLETSSTTVSALQVIQQSTGMDLGWQDDPCSPTPWKHIQCEGSLVTSLYLSGINLRAISPTFGDLLDLKTLDLHNTSLTGEIQNLGSLQELKLLNLSFNQLTSFGSDFSTLVRLQILDLQNNSIQGTIPDGLGNLKELHLLNLENNRLHGVLPQSLNRESLEIRTSGNLCLAFSSSTCNDESATGNPIEIPQVTIFPPKKHSGHSRRAVIIGAIGGAICALILTGLLAFIFKRKKKGTDDIAQTRAMIDMRSWNATRVLSYKEIKAATNNFKEVIGRGSFGSVYLGKLPGGKLVAVKVRFDQTQLGADSFINEVHLLSQVHHQNLVSLEGFCYESKKQILVYEYLPGGSLTDNLYGPNSKKLSLSWIRRLKIAIDAAKGLDYLHNGSNPRIIHRDVKSCNILLDTNMNAKVCDFGLSKQVPQAETSHVTTVVKGTAGYLDPEYYSTQQLTEKSDVYSFGVVLLELICGREPLSRTGCPDSYNLVLWAKPYLQAGTFEIVDESLKGSYDMESMRKVASIASRAVERDASERPTMAEILTVLKDAYSIQFAFLASGGHLS
ncbi:hypothetical protein Syun_006366 [Stephania yunnanensis]|uniref:non-specific serine/threonine protein kinase n=1 Tax=Stephania yunnanensis TaxID=152371 RepID=A0AAP0KXG5_9MAGN